MSINNTHNKIEKNNQNHSSQDMNFVYRFFCWCSGARLYLLKKCPTDFNTYFGIGIIILLTGIMAFISGSYAFFTVFKSTPLAIIFGIFWGTLIFFLDWYLVSSLKKQNNRKQEIAMSIPRLILAFFLAVVISKPIELKLFEKEIDNQIASIQIKNGINNQTLIDKEFTEIETLKQSNEKLAIQLKAKEIERNKLFEMVVKEAEGNSITGKIGKGPVYKEKKQAYDKSEAELIELKASILPMISDNNLRIKDLTVLRDKRVSQNSEIVQNTDGFLARMEAMGQLMDSNKRITMISWFILLLFITIESAPLLVKLLASRGAYDELLDVEHYKKQIEAKRIIAELRNSETKEYKLKTENNNEEYETAKSLNNDFLQKVSDAQKDINQAIVDKWKKNEYEKIEQNFSEIMPKIDQIFGIQKPIPTPEIINNTTDGSGKEKMA